MLKNAAFAAGLALLSLTLVAQDRQDAKTVVKAIDWAGSLDELKVKASKEHKPIFWLNVVGELDDSI